jgi:hypothetical protein
VKLSYITKIQDGKIPDRTRKKIAEELSSLEGKRVEITVQRLSRKRSVQQNRYYWGVLVERVREAFKETGTLHDPETIHEFLKSQSMTLQNVMVNPETGETRLFTSSSTTLTPIEFEEYMDECRMLAAEWFGISIPEPEAV